MIVSLLSAFISHINDAPEFLAYCLAIVVFPEPPIPTSATDCIPVFFDSFFSNSCSMSHSDDLPWIVCI